MSKREPLTAAEIEARCVAALNKLPGLATIQYAKIRPFIGFILSLTPRSQLSILYGPRADWRNARSLSA